MMLLLLLVMVCEPFTMLLLLLMVSELRKLLLLLLVQTLCGGCCGCSRRIDVGIAERRRAEAAQMATR